MEMKREHLVPLAPAAVEAIEAIRFYGRGAGVSRHPERARTFVGKRIGTF